MMKKMVVVCLVLSMVQFFAFAQEAEVTYSVHMAGVGWGGYSFDGETAGTTGQSRQIEAIKVKVVSSIAGGIRYDVHVQGIGWVGWSSNDAEAGTTGQSRRLEAIRVQLTGQLAERYDVMYRVHMAGVGWSGWSENGADAGTTGQSRQLEAIEVKLSAKHAAAPLPTVSTTGSVVTIHFEPDSVVLLSSEQAKLDQIADTLRRSDNDIIVSGHAAMAGDAEGRQAVSLARARAVVEYLIGMGFASSRMGERGYGAEQPVGDNSTPEGMALNRRVEITLE